MPKHSHQREAEAQLLQLNAEQQDGDRRRTRNQAIGRVKQDDLGRGHSVSSEALADVGGMVARMCVVLVAEIHVVVIVLLF